MGWTVLIIDDSRTIQEVVRMTFLHTGFTALPAMNAEEGLRLAKKVRPHLILVDTRLAGMDGYEVCRQLKAHPATKLIPVLLFLGKHLEPDWTLSKEVRAQGFFFKPFDTQELLDQAQLLCEAAERDMAQAPLEALTDEPETLAEEAAKEPETAAAAEAQEIFSSSFQAILNQVETQLEVRTPEFDFKSEEETEESLPELEPEPFPDEELGEVAALPAEVSAEEESWAEPDGEGVIRTDTILRLAKEPETQAPAAEGSAPPQTAKPIQLSEEEAANLLEWIEDEEEPIHQTVQAPHPAPTREVREEREAFELFDDIVVAPANQAETFIESKSEAFLQMDRLRNVPLSRLAETEEPTVKPQASLRGMDLYGLDDEPLTLEAEEAPSFETPAETPMETPEEPEPLVEAETSAEEAEELPLKAEDEFIEEFIEEVGEVFEQKPADAAEAFFFDQEPERRAPLAAAVPPSTEEELFKSEEESEATVIPAGSKADIKPFAFEVMDDDEALTPSFEEATAPHAFQAPEAKAVTDSFKEALVFAQAEAESVIIETPAEMAAAASDLEEADEAVELADTTGEHFEIQTEEELEKLDRRTRMDDRRARFFSSEPARQSEWVATLPRLNQEKEEPEAEQPETAAASGAVSLEQLVGAFRRAIREEMKAGAPVVAPPVVSVGSPVPPSELLRLVRETVRVELKPLLSRPVLAAEETTGVSDLRETIRTEIAAMLDERLKPIEDRLTQLAPLAKPSSAPSAGEVAQAVKSTLEGPLDHLRHTMEGSGLGEQIHTWIASAVSELPTAEELRRLAAGVSAPAISTVGGGASSEDLRKVLREELGATLGERIEGIAWEVVPELAEALIVQELQRLTAERA